MTDTWLEIAWINQTKGILHGMVEGVEVERVVTDEERELLYALNERHRDEEQALLKSFAS